MEYFFSHKMKKILPFETAWLEFENIMLSKIKLKKEREILYHLTYM